VDVARQSAAVTFRTQAATRATLTHRPRYGTGLPPTGACGAPEHDWLPAKLLGDIVAFERVDAWSLTASTINMAATALGMGALADGTFDVQAYRVRYVTQDRGVRVEATAVARVDDDPLLVIEAELDDLVWAAPNRDDVPLLCAQGYEIEYQECAGAGHTDGAVQSLPYQWQWLQARLAGRPLTGTCVVNAPVDCTALTLPP
jgi:hypothetical protein